MILGAVKVSDDFYGDFAAVLGIRPHPGAFMKVYSQYLAIDGYAGVGTFAALM